ncbi:MAG: ABC transporter substrate-binding protein, partial [Alphaproteobacteria bacterium]|nr:ABC transporter substrate-binding protein [Alphaproteobacteria bacterium]
LKREGENMKTLALKFTGAKFAGVKFARTTTAGDSGGRSRFVRWGGVAIVAYLLASVGTADAQETIKIGLGVPVTGDWAAYSEWPGAQCMAEMINSEGGVDGRQIEVLVQDSASDTETAVAQAQRLLDAGAVILGTEPFDSTMIPVAQLAAPYGVSLFQPQSTQVEMHVGIVNNFFTGVSPDPFTATAAANYALEQGVRDVVLFTSDDGGSWSSRTPVWCGDVVGAGRRRRCGRRVGCPGQWRPWEDRQELGGPRRGFPRPERDGGRARVPRGVGRPRESRGNVGWPPGPGRRQVPPRHA